MYLKACNYHYKRSGLRTSVNVSQLPQMMHHQWLAVTAVSLPKLESLNQMLWLCIALHQKNLSAKEMDVEHATLVVVKTVNYSTFVVED